MESPTLFLLTAIIVILAGLLAIFSLYYARLFMKLHKTQKEVTYLRFHLQEKSLEKINAARDRSLKILSDASMQAEQILSQADLLKKDMNMDVRKQLEALTKKQKETLTESSGRLLQEFQQLVKDLTNEDINIYKDVTKDIERVTIEEVKSFEERLHNETIGQEKIVDQKIEEAFEKTKQEIENYKKEKLASVDSEVESILQEVTKEVLGKRLSFQDHQDIIKAALEKAKQEIVTKEV